MTNPRPFLSGRSYDALKFLAQIFLPALGALYFALSTIWGLPAGEQVVGTITVVDAFLGVLLGVSSSSYDKSEAKYDGTIKVLEDDKKKTFSLELNGDPNELDTKKSVIFKVNAA